MFYRLKRVVGLQAKKVANYSFDILSLKSNFKRFIFNSLGDTSFFSKKIALQNFSLASSCLIVDYQFEK